MPPTEREARIIFGWTYDDASQKRVEQGLARVDKVVTDGAKSLGEYSARTQTGLDNIDKAMRRGIQTSMQSREAMAGWEKAQNGVEGVALRINTQLERMARAAAVDAIANDAVAAARASGQWADALERAATQLSAIKGSDSEIRRVAETIGEAAQTGDGGGGGSGRTVGRLGRIGREVRALPAIQLSGSLSTDAIGKILYTVDSGLSALGASAVQIGAASVVAAPAVIALAIAVGRFQEGWKTASRRWEPR
ncbi:MAG: hypothetical protein IPK17_38485 [Chloroflexi bacterium]|uniref:hypothetical protein n=1 Tax=Candidatus Flexifilum breve TaxID=3140694 RepID=UPI003134D456|nr:hypothetical protein [Chloroflexota bacterium]